MSAFWRYFLDFFGLGWAFQRLAQQPVAAGRGRSAGDGLDSTRGRVG